MPEQDGSIDFCSTDAITDLFGSLGGTPDSGGTWSPALASGTGDFNPSVDPAGVYTYTVVATGFCTVDATATVTVGLTTAPNAGTDGTIDFCSTDAITDLYGSLGGTPDVGGTWSPALASGTGNFNPAVDPAGVYTYTIIGTGGCVNATATVTVGLTPAPNAGTDGSIDFCSTDATTDLFGSLGGTPDVGGTWSPALASGTGDFNPAVDTAGVYTYTVVATGSCLVDATATVTVGLTIAPEAGTDGTIDFCSTDATTDLFTSLGGTPDTGGTWSPALASGTGNFNPAVDPAGVYIYTVLGTGSCTNATATVTVGLTMAHNAGGNGSVTFCTNDTSLPDLYDSLTGTADTGGTWSPALASGTGNFNPAVDAAGVYTYTVSGGFCTDDTATVTVSLTTASNAGTNGSIDFCSTDAITDLFVSLGTADTGGTWSPALASGTGDFNPSVDTAGVYTYTIIGTGSCADDSATVTVGLTAAANAGIDGAIDFCSTDTTTDLFASLGGTPDTGGTWSPALASGTGMFNPAVDAAGTYTYTITGTGGCTDDTATVIVGLTVAPNAGTDGSIDFCSTDATTDLFASLGGTPDTGGTWLPALASGTGSFNPAVDAAGVYTYTVAATGFCSVDDTATVTVGLTTAPNAGTNGTIDFCSTDATTDLFASLGGTPDTGGTWSPALTSGTGDFNPSVDPAGVYTYTVSGSGVCTDATATVTVGLTVAPNAGTNDSIDFCSTDAITDLFASLGTADTGGVWSPALASGTGDFNPSVDTAGVYTYTVAATGFCSVDDSATVTVGLTAAPNSGTDGAIFFCMTDTSADLFDSLNGIPDTGGTWSPALTSGTGVFDPAVDSAGDYTYTVTGSGVCANATTTVRVTLSEAPIITSVTVVDFSDNNTITVNVEGAVSGTSFGIGDYEYSIDDINFQSENIIQNIAPGEYTITVRDANGCLPHAYEFNVIVMGAPSFFTPNNDGQNDFWQIVNIQSQPNAIINIFDRFGKLIAQLDPTSLGWDGYYNGEALPSTDYWFTVSMEDSEGNSVVRKGHFSLIRR